MLLTSIQEELNVWIKYYSTDTEGIGGKIKNFSEDFKVIENSEIERDENGQHMCIVIEKRNINTEDVLEFLSKKLKIQKKFIGCAGNKDKNSVAIQKISIPFSEKIYEEIEKLNNENFKIIDKFRIKRKIRYGYLKGNSFEIIVRGCNNVERIEKIKKELNHVPNYYGYQRFGIKQNNPIIGKLLLQRNYKEVVEILKNDFQFKLNFDLDPKKILRQIPIHILSFYISSYQSLLFNKIVSKRLEKFGFEKVDNDFVNSKKEIVIPIIGYKIKFPKGEMGEIIEKVMEEEKIRKEDFLHEIKPLSFKGDFRKLFLNFKNFSYDIINNNTVKFKFELEKGGFATILLREFCKNKFW